jgi:hypothetical protein
MSLSFGSTNGAELPTKPEVMWGMSKIRTRGSRSVTKPNFVKVLVEYILL